MVLDAMVDVVLIIFVALLFVSPFHNKSASVCMSAYAPLSPTTHELGNHIGTERKRKNTWTGANNRSVTLFVRPKV